MHGKYRRVRRIKEAFRRLIKNGLPQRSSVGSKRTMSNPKATRNSVKAHQEKIRIHPILIIHPIVITHPILLEHV